MLIIISRWQRLLTVGSIARLILWAGFRTATDLTLAVTRRIGWAAVRGFIVRWINRHTWDRDVDFWTARSIPKYGLSIQRRANVVSIIHLRPVGVSLFQMVVVHTNTDNYNDIPLGSFIAFEIYFHFAQTIYETVKESWQQLAIHSGYASDADRPQSQLLQLCAPCIGRVASPVHVNKSIETDRQKFRKLDYVSYIALPERQECQQWTIIIGSCIDRWNRSSVSANA